MTAVTVIIPVHDGAEFVAEAIESVLGQTLRDCRIIAVDDGSTDATPAVLARFGSRIRVIRHENRGLPAARNGALAVADSEYVAFLDHDDLWEPAFLERGVAHLAAAPDHVAGAVAGWVRIDRDGRELPGTGVAPRGLIGLRELVLGNRFACGAVVLRRRALVDSGGFDTELRAAEDWDLWLRLAASGWQFTTVGASLWRYRLHDRNISNNADVVRQDALHTLEKLFGHPALPPDVLACRARAVGNVFLHASEALYATGREADARRDFAAAVETCADLLHDDETYYSIVCAAQPPGYKASPYHLDLMAGQQRILQALSACRDGGLIDAAHHRRAMGRAYRALAALAFGQRRMRDVRRYAGCALRADAALWRDRRTLMPALKSLAGAQLVDAVSRWRQRAGARPRAGRLDDRGRL